MPAEVIADNRHVNGAQLQRLRFIDFLLDHYGQFNRAVIMDYFGMSKPQASLDIQAYIQLAPGNVEYNRSRKYYERTTQYERAIR